jgi:hypothetical protein
MQKRKIWVLTFIVVLIHCQVFAIESLTKVSAQTLALNIAG